MLEQNFLEFLMKGGSTAILLVVVALQARLIQELLRQLEAIRTKQEEHIRTLIGINREQNTNLVSLSTGIERLVNRPSHI